MKKDNDKFGKNMVLLQDKYRLELFSEQFQKILMESLGKIYIHKN